MQLFPDQSPRVEAPFLPMQPLFPEETLIPADWKEEEKNDPEGPELGEEDQVGPR